MSSRHSCGNPTFGLFGYEVECYNNLLDNIGLLEKNAVKKPGIGIMLLAMVLSMMIPGCYTPEKKVTLNYDEWMAPRCGRCHTKSEFPYLLKEASKMTRKEFQNVLPGMVHGDIRMDEKEIGETLDYLDSLGIFKKVVKPEEE